MCRGAPSARLGQVAQSPPSSPAARRDAAHSLTTAAGCLCCPPAAFCGTGGAPPRPEGCGAAFLRLDGWHASGAMLPYLYGSLFQTITTKLRTGCVRSEGACKRICVQTTSCGAGARRSTTQMPAFGHSLPPRHFTLSDIRIGSTHVQSARCVHLWKPASCFRLAQSWR